MRWLACSLLWAGLVHAQITIVTVDARGVETPVEGLLDVGTVAAADWSDTRFRLRNTGAVTVALSALRVSGAGFLILGNPPLPYQMVPRANVDFRIRFSPAAFGSYSATLLFNEKTLFLRGFSPPGITLLVEREGKLEVAATTAPIVLGRVERGGFLTRKFQLRNDTPAVLTLHRVATSGDGFSSPLGIAAPLTLDPGRSIPFEIRFTPPRNGILQGLLNVEERAFPLEGVGFDPPFPDAIITVEPAVESGRQAKVSLRLAAPSPISGVATLRLEFRSAVQAAPDDPAVVFLSSGTRSVPVNIREGDTNMGEVSFQTGTTAGEIRFRIEMPGQIVAPQTIATTVARAMVSINVTKATRAFTSLQLEIAGFDNTRTASRLTFRFFDRAGNPLADPILADASEAFQRHYRDTTVGGVFLLRANFPVAGDSSLLSAFEVEIVNSAGAVRSRAGF